MILFYLRSALSGIILVISNLIIRSGKADIAIAQKVPKEDSVSDGRCFLLPVISGILVRKFLNNLET